MMEENNNLFEGRTEHEIELDPDIEELVTDAETQSDASASQTASEPVSSPTAPAPSAFQPVEPIAPIMPEIKRAEYHPIESNGSSRGMKVFAVVVAMMVLASAGVTGGYFLGRRGMGGSVTQVDLASKPAPEDAKTVSELYADVNPSIVGIYVYNANGVAASATGVIYSADGYVVTNDHIYDGVASAKFKVYTHDGKMLSADYVAGDTRSDLAVLKIQNPSGLTPATFGNSNELAVGESVVAIGRPNGASLPSSISEGIVSATNRRASITTSYTGKYIQTDTAINPGSSGGALCNIYGQVVGITSAKLVGNEYEGVGFAIPTTTMKTVVESLIANKTVKGRAKLGISYQAVDPLSAEVSGLPCGLKIASIDQSSDLYNKSVSQGDIITHVNGTEITDSTIMLDVIEQASPGDTLSLTIYSASSKTSFTITVRLLEDQGQSSYTTEQSGGNASGSGNSSQYNSSQFSFPNGD